MVNLLVVEDNMEISLLIKSILSDLGEVVVAKTLLEATMFCEKSDFQLVIIDISLPDGSGFELVQKFRENMRESIFPFFIITGDLSIQTQISSFSLGAEDFLTKPFNPLVLKARVNNCLRRTTGHHWIERKLGDIVISHKELRVFKLNSKGIKIECLELTTLEFRLLSAFIERKGHALDRQILISLVWGNVTNVIDRVVDQHICSLRKKLKGTLLKINSLYGFGYRLEILGNISSVESEEHESKQKSGFGFHS